MGCPSTEDVSKLSPANAELISFRAGTQIATTQSVSHTYYYIHRCADCAIVGSFYSFNFEFTAAATPSTLDSPEPHDAVHLVPVCNEYSVFHAAAGPAAAGD